MQAHDYLSQKIVGFLLITERSMNPPSEVRSLVPFHMGPEKADGRVTLHHARQWRRPLGKLSSPEI